MDTIKDPLLNNDISQPSQLFDGKKIATKGSHNKTNQLKDFDPDQPLAESSKFITLGNVDAGKSTFIGVMKTNKLDDGNGLARSFATKVKHEIETGRTSTHSFHYLTKQNEVTTLIDLCGHEKYLKTTLFGVTGLFGDYGLVIVGANMGLCGMTKEHLGLLISNKIPFLTVMTKVDICPENIMLETKKELMRLAKSNKKELIFFEEEEAEINGSYLKDAHLSVVESFQEKRTDLMPVIMISNKTGHNIPFVRELLTSIHSPIYLQKKGLITNNTHTITSIDSNYPAILYIDSTYSVIGIGIVLSGTLKYGSIELGQTLYLGPVNNTFITITVKSIQNCLSEDVTILEKDTSGSIGIRLETKGSYTREMFSKGQVATANFDFGIKHTCYNYTATVAVFNHPTTIKNGYQTVIHCGTIRQAGKFKIEDIIEKDEKTGEEKIVPQTLRTGSRADIGIRFISRPEFILPHTMFMFRDGKTKGLGKILTITPFMEEKKDETLLESVSSKKRLRHRNDKLVRKTGDQPQSFKSSSVSALTMASIASMTGTSPKKVNPVVKI